ncbi:hypothetical protein LHJ74_05830 [Streptomyces sp. N2-109]|uniref:Class F sortase n=1 Tax=Streptomyces gossypii TaxID=2883101 RepID=A0ABT2JNJ1_9ACTN|nr:hypothetical protein [Streptomyces gossypii]MCT2589453.1 hypothetical protein [Streptomyces gossypii]
MPTRHERLSLRGRRLEAAALVGSVLLTVLLCRLAPAEAERGAVASDRGVSYAATGARSDAVSGERAAEGLPRSAPTRLRIARTDTDVRVTDVAGVPGEGGPPEPVRAAAGRVVWYRGGPSPGEPGPALLAGPLGTRGGRAALAGLGGLRRGAVIDIWRSDGSLARFVVDRVTRYGAPRPGTAGVGRGGGRFPGEEVYGGTERPELRLIGRADAATDGAGVVIFAHLTATPA